MALKNIRSSVESVAGKGFQGLKVVGADKAIKHIAPGEIQN
ncbi:MAG: hypothetical protein QM488_18355 [Rhizobiaceae bacterium]